MAGVAGVGFKRGNEGVGEGDRGSKYKGKLEKEKRKRILGGEGRNHAGGFAGALVRLKKIKNKNR